MDIRITKDKPLQKDRWNQLCRINGNAVQHTIYDTFQEQFHYTTYYLEILDQEQLLAGLKFYYYESNRLKWLTKRISKHISIMGESIFAPHLDVHLLQNKINETIDRFIQENKLVESIVAGYYGDTQKLLACKNYKNRSDFHFKTTNINLSLTEEKLWENIHSKHRNVIRKAEKEGVVFEESNNYELFEKLLLETYSNQGIENFNTNMTRVLYNMYETEDMAKIYFVKHGEEYLSAAILFVCGNVAYYAFGGNKVNSIGAGNYLQWKIMLELKKAGYSLYCLGQIAQEADPNNTKFTVGISTFKSRFGGYELPSYRYVYEYLPLHNKLFKWLLGLRG